jgi:hypothetical protein
LEFTSIHRGVGLASIVRIPVILIATVILMAIEMKIIDQLVDRENLSELIILLVFGVSLGVSAWLVGLWLKPVPVEKLKFLPGTIEWTFDVGPRERVRSFSGVGLEILKVHFDYVFLRASNGEKFTVHRRWLPTSELGTNISYCEMKIEDTKLVMEGFRVTRKRKYRDVKSVGTVFVFAEESS